MARSYWVLPRELVGFGNRRLEVCDKKGIARFTDSSVGGLSFWLASRKHSAAPLQLLWALVTALAISSKIS